MKNQLTGTKFPHAANDDNYNTEVKEVEKEQKTPVLKKAGKWIVDNKWRILVQTGRVIMRWEVYKEKAAWLYETLKHLI